MPGRMEYPDGKKTCRKCGHRKEIDTGFYWKNGQPFSPCKTCINAKQGKRKTERADRIQVAKPVLSLPGDGEASASSEERRTPTPPTSNMLDVAPLVSDWPQSPGDAAITLPADPTYFDLAECVRLDHGVARNPPPLLIAPAPVTVTMRYAPKTLIIDQQLGCVRVIHADGSEQVTPFASLHDKLSLGTLAILGRAGFIVQALVPESDALEVEFEDQP